MELQNLQAELSRINAELAKVQSAEKIMTKIKKTKLRAVTAHKYFDLQAAYVQAINNRSF